MDEDKVWMMIMIMINMIPNICRSVPGLPAAASQLPPAAAPEPSKRWNLRSVKMIMMMVVMI